MIAAERETVLAFADADTEAHVFTCRRADVRRLRAKAHAGVREVAGGFYADGTEWAEFRIPTDRLNLAAAVKRASRPRSCVLGGVSGANQADPTSGSGRYVEVGETPSGSTIREVAA